MPYIKLSSGSVHFSDQGQGAPLVLLHANPGDSRDFDAVAPSLARQYRVLALDWPGYGKSRRLPEPASATVASFEEVLKEWLSALGLPPAVFIGNSIGGHVATRLAIAQPAKVRGLVLVSPGGFTPHNLLTRTICWFQGSQRSVRPQRFARMYLHHNTPVVEAMLQRARTEQSEPDTIELNRAMWRSFGRPENDLRADASRIQAPTLLLFGAHDPVISARKDGQVAARSIPGSRLVVLPCGHAPFAEVPDQFLDQVQPFLQVLPT